MSIYAASRDPSATAIRAALANFIRDFETDAAAHRTRIRDLFDNDQELFYEAALDVLNSPGESRGAHYMVSLLAANGMLLRALCHPELSREEAVELTRTARKFDPMIDVALARNLADSALGVGTVPVSDPARLMDLLSEIADPARIMPSLMRMMRHPNPYLRSKAVKMIGRASHSVKWVMGRLSESDQRVRANAIESLWTVDTPEARALLSFAVSDANNRVVGNALLGLYYLGDSAVLPEIAKLASHVSALFRATAASVMGETADPRFAEALRRLIGDPDAAVRKCAFASLGQLRAANSQPPPGDAWHLSGRTVEPARPARAEASSCWPLPPATCASRRSCTVHNSCSARAVSIVRSIRSPRSRYRMP